MITGFVILAMAVGSGAFIASLAQVSKSLRMWLLGRSKPGSRGSWKFWRWLFDLLNCPFCVSVWLSLGATAIWQPRLVPYFWPLGYLVTALARSSGAMAAVLVIRKALGKL